MQSEALTPEDTTPENASPEKKKLSKENWLLLISLYVSISLPLGFFFVALVAIMRQQGTPLEQLSIIYVAGMFWAIKFLWAPLIDRWRFGFLGHYRGWLILIQIGVLLSLYALSTLHVVDDFMTVVFITMIIGFLSATQDAAANALAYRLLPSDDRGMGNSLHTSGGMIGNLFGAGVILMLYPTIGWEGSIYLLMLGIALSAILVIRFKETDFEYHSPSVKESMKRFISFWKRPKGMHWFLILAVYPLGISLAWPLITPMLVDVKWGLDDIGFVVNVIGSAVGIVGALLAGWLVKKIGRTATVYLTLLMQIPTVLLLILITNGYSDYISVALIVSALFFGYSPVMAVVYTLMMDHASEKHPATDIALQYSLFNLFSIGASVTATAMAGFYGYTNVLIAASIVVVLALLVSFKYPFKEFKDE